MQTPAACIRVESGAWAGPASLHTSVVTHRAIMPHAESERAASPGLDKHSHYSGLPSVVPATPCLVF